MSLNILYNTCLKPRFSARTAESIQLNFCQDLADGLNEWFTMYFAKIINPLYGTATYPPSVIATLGTPASPLMIAKPITAGFLLTGLGIRTALSVSTGGFANLFTYIGTEITSKIITWTAAPMIIGIGTGVFVTTHFALYGQKLLAEMSLLKPEDTDITNKLWDLFEKYLRDAINAIPPTPVIYTGVIGPGVFTGTIQGSLRTL